MNMLDRTEQRIVGVLIEKELAVPDSYPLTLNALVAGCNQKSNRHPEMGLEEFEVEGALMSLRLKEWVVESDRDGGRTKRFKHRIEEKLGVSDGEKAVLAELLLRGPQTPMELKNRVGRMGFHAQAPEIEQMLRAFAERPTGALVVLLPRAPRERDARWAHTLGPRDEAAEESMAAQAPASRTAPAQPPSDLGQRVAALERRVEELERRLGEGAAGAE